jgi:hypothetical protein
MTDEEFERMLAGLPEGDQGAMPRQPVASSASRPAFTAIPDRRDDSFLKKAGRFAMGFGAGYAGRGDEYLDSLQKKRKEKDMQLLKATALDARNIQQAIQNENFPKAIDVLVDRMNLLEQMGEDISDTKMLRDALIGGRPDIVMGELNTFLSSLPKQAIDPKMITSQGQMVTQSLGGTPTAQTVSGFIPEAESTEGQMGAAKTIAYNNGTMLVQPRIGASRLYAPDGTLVTDPAQRKAILDTALAEGIAYESDISQGRERGASQEKRIQLAIDDGIDAAQRIPKLREARNILETVGTGNMNAVALAFKQRLGIASADESQLIYELAKNVLSQLKPTFGAAFTAREGDLLRRIEANTNNSTEGNKRLLDELIEALQLDVNRARLEARENKDTRSLNAIDGYLSQQFGSSITAEPSGTPTQRIRVDANGDIIEQ